MIELIRRLRQRMLQCACNDPLKAEALVYGVGRCPECEDDKHAIQGATRRKNK